MKETARYYRSKFCVMRGRGWVVVPYSKKSVGEELAWCRTHGVGEFYYVCEANQPNWSFVFSSEQSAQLFNAAFSE